MKRLLKYVFLDIVKNRIILLYTVVLAALAWSAFALEDNAAKGLLTLLSLVLLTVPLVAILFSTIYLYNSSEFIELLVSHPVRRAHIWWSLFIGLSLSFVAAFVLGAGIPLFLYAPPEKALLMLIVGCVVSVIFVGLAFLAAIFSRDKAKGIGLALLGWLYFALLFDGLVLFVLFQFSDYPIEQPMVALSALNPLDLSRILLLLQLDGSAMLGYTGAIFQRFFGSTKGLLMSGGLLALWAVLPFLISLRRFTHKDL